MFYTYCSVDRGGTANRNTETTAGWTVRLMRVVKKINVYSKLNSPHWSVLSNLKDNATAFISR